jgi:hypothetical protein
VSRASEPGLLVLHAVRVLGTADDAAVAARYGLDPALVREELLDAEAYGLVAWAEFAGVGGWSLTERGRAEDERRLAAELAADPAADAAGVVRGVLVEFDPLNGRVRQACTDWQLRPGPAGRLDINDHTDPAWDDRVLGALLAGVDGVRPLLGRLAALLTRFAGYEHRLDAALGAAYRGDVSRVAGLGAASVHGVWMELHEDLLATAGVSRGGS